nr:beta-ketoacyl synthase chain length factor [uncultured Rhodopila sp.]
MIALFVAGVAVRGDGLDGWEAARPVLAGEAPYVPAPARLPPPAILAPNERRRAGPVTRLALAVASEAAESSGLPPASLRSVFASSNGDGATIHAILQSLAEPGAAVSPTQFHNSVHNAAAGYWSIGAGSRQPATCLGCHDATVGAALLAAAAEAGVEQQPVLLCVYDIPLPEPLNTARPAAGVFGAGLVLSPVSLPGALARIRIEWVAGAPPPGREAPRVDPGGLSRTNPAARIMRLLEALACRRADHLVIGLLDGHVAISIEPCSTAPALPR